VDLVFEAVVENMDLKKQLFSDLDRRCPPQTIFEQHLLVVDH